MRVLLDTCTFVWLAADPDQLSPAVRKALERPDAELFLSDVSVWEICLKWKAAKLRLPAPPRVWVEEQAATWRLGRTPLEAGDFYRTTELPDLHRDPFDRLLVAQALAHGFTLATPDPAIAAYPVAVVW